MSIEEGHGLAPNKDVPRPVDEIGEMARVKATGEPPEEPLRDKMLELAESDEDA